MKYRFMGRRKILWFSISLFIITIGIISLFVWKLPFGIDFKGGTNLELQLEKTPSVEQVRDKVNSIDDIKGATVTTTENGTYLIKTTNLSPDEQKTLTDGLGKDYGTVTVKQSDTVGPTISNDLTNKAILAVVLASLFIILYLAFSFRGVVKPVSSWRFGITAVIALLHDLLVTVGVFAILAHFLNFEVDSSIIPALLTVMGFSVHDTIVVFDRLRENLHVVKGGGDVHFEKLADESVDQTLNRSLATSLTVIFTLTALALIGGSSIRPFVLTLLVGITIGTYSSIFTATPLLVVWQNRVSKSTIEKVL